MLAENNTVFSVCRGLCLKGKRKKVRFSPCSTVHDSGRTHSAGRSACSSSKVFQHPPAKQTQSHHYYQFFHHQQRLLATNQAVTCNALHFSVIKIIKSTLTGFFPQVVLILYQFLEFSRHFQKQQYSTLSRNRMECYRTSLSL